MRNSAGAAPGHEAVMMRRLAQDAQRIFLATGLHRSTFWNGSAGGVY